MSSTIERVSGAHDWRVYDEHHRGCVRCGLRLFYSAGTNSDAGGRGWRFLSFYGVPSALMLRADDLEPFGGCTPPSAAGETVLIEYTGNPDHFPGCERIMHRIPPASSDAVLLDLASIQPFCKVKCLFWELGPARAHPGWNWCWECYPGRSARPQQFAPVARELPKATTKATPKLPKPRKKRGKK